jgi:hypothetical protein
MMPVKNWAGYSGGDALNCCQTPSSALGKGNDCLGRDIMWFSSVLPGSSGIAHQLDQVRFIRTGHPTRLRNFTKLKIVFINIANVM